MDINYSRFLLAVYCSNSPIKNKMYRDEEEPLGDIEIAHLLHVSIDVWMAHKPEILENCFEKDEKGAIKIHDKFLENMNRILAEIKIDKISPEVQAFIDEMQEIHKRPLKPHQLLIEKYKRLKGVEKNPDWDRINFRKYLRPAGEIIKQLGLEKGILIMEWIAERVRNRRLKWWNMQSVFKLYDIWWKETSKNEDEYVSSGQDAIDKYK